MTKRTRSIVGTSVFILCCCSIYLGSNSFAAVVGDIDSDGQITLVESIYALRVTSGLTTPIPDTICYTSGLADCSGNCVDTMNNPNYCGGCDTSCPEGYLCVSGTCANVCDDGDDICTNDMFDLIEGCTHTILPECQSSCNPVTQTECPPDYKCSYTADNGTICTPDWGNRTSGEYCELLWLPEENDCIAGALCVDNICQEICTVNPDSCPGGWTCIESPEYFSDLTDVGLCEPLCDPVGQDCLDTSEACYLEAVSGDTYCMTIPELAEGLVQDTTCYADSGGVCDLNSCDKGYQSGFLIDNLENCSFFCNPIDNWLNNTNGLAGDSAGITCNSTFGGVRPDGPQEPGYECVYIQSIFSNTHSVAATTGTCRPVTPEPDPGYRSCAVFDWVRLQADILDETANQVGYCDAHPDRCMVECISRATWDNAFPTQSLNLQLSNLTSKSIK